MFGVKYGIRAACVLAISALLWSATPASANDPVPEIPDAKMAMADGGMCDHNKMDMHKMPMDKQGGEKHDMAEHVCPVNGGDCPGHTEKKHTGTCPMDPKTCLLKKGQPSEQGDAPQSLSAPSQEIDAPAVQEICLTENAVPQTVNDPEAICRSDGPDPHPPRR